MIQVCVKAKNLVTDEIIYEGAKKTYTSYNEAWNDIHNSLYNRYAIIKSYKLPNEFVWRSGKNCYVSTRHGNIRVTTYIKR